jgi:2-oxoisovalerate dehydrogenase E1 component
MLASRCVARRLATRRVARCGSSYLDARAARSSEVDALLEVVELANFEQRLSSGALTAAAGAPLSLEDAGIDAATFDLALRAGFATLALHSEARVASLLGHGFYTIGPCGEELLAAVGLTLRADDAMALHYRHLATQIARQLRDGRSMEDVLLDRARGYVVSASDPVTGGAHCAVGGGASDFIVTSTLASQAPPAVGRALGNSVAHALNVPSAAFPKNFVSYVSLGDGSVNNGHFLSAANLAEYAKHRKYKCPVVFGVSDNNLCISLRGHDWLKKFAAQRLGGMETFACDGSNLLDVFRATKAATERARRRREPVALLFHNMPRRFGHAATDRQSAYLTSEEIAQQAERNPLESACLDAVRLGVAPSLEALRETMRETRELVKAAFACAAEEPKITSREAMMEIVSQPLAPLPPPLPVAAPAPAAAGEGAKQKKPKTAKRAVMRKHMTQVFGEALALDERVVYVGEGASDRFVCVLIFFFLLFADTLFCCSPVVYVGEDVEHGGYYLVTDGLAKKCVAFALRGRAPILCLVCAALTLLFPPPPPSPPPPPPLRYPHRVRDFPPDETTLVGAAIGFSQAGLVPVLEIPYAKYLDCGADMFGEACIMQWLSNGKQPNGMVVRLQGFDRGVFGGNFHTHNMLACPPGLDVGASSRHARVLLFHYFVCLVTRSFLTARHSFRFYPCSTRCKSASRAATTTCAACATPCTRRRRVASS